MGQGPLGPMGKAPWARAGPGPNGQGPMGPGRTQAQWARPHGPGAGPGPMDRAQITEGLAKSGIQRCAPEGAQRGVRIHPNPEWILLMSGFISFDTFSQTPLTRAKGERVHLSVVPYKSPDLASPKGGH